MTKKNQPKTAIERTQEAARFLIFTRKLDRAEKRKRRFKKCLSKVYNFYRRFTDFVIYTVVYGVAILLIGGLLLGYDVDLVITWDETVEERDLSYDEIIFRGLQSDENLPL